MQDRYAGDIGDYVKLAILRHLAIGKRLGVAWWLFPDEYNGDGRHTDYLSDPDKWRKFDPELFDGLLTAVLSGNRSVVALHKLLPPQTRFACDPIPCNAKPYSRRPVERVKWFQKVKTELDGRNIIFVDPDNGLEPKAFKLTRYRAGKSVQFQELEELAQNDRALIVYHHYFRQQHDEQIRILAERMKSSGFRSVDALRWHRTSPRAFFLLNASDEIQQQASDIEGRWEGHISLQINIT